MQHFALCVKCKRAVAQIPANARVCGGETLFHRAFQEIGSHLVQHVTEPVIDCRKQDRLMNAGRVLEGERPYGGALR